MSDDKPRDKKWRRTYIKLFCYEFLHGSISYQLTDAEQNIWTKLLLLCGLCGGYTIADHDGRPYPHSFISHEFHIDRELLEKTLEKCKEEGRITEDEQGIHITNWEKYQDEYSRQKPYRDKWKEEREAKKGEKGQDTHPLIDTERLRMISQRVRQKKKELGRDLSHKELQDIKDEVAQELEGE